MQCGGGLGQRLSSLDDIQIERILKSGYAADALFVVSMGLAKASLANTTSTLAQGSLKRIIQASEGLIGLWAVSALFAALFQCRLPSPWDYIEGTCIDRVGFAPPSAKHDGCIRLELILTLECLLDLFLHHEHRNRPRRHRRHDRGY